MTRVPVSTLRRIILTRTTGQLGNRLAVGSHVMAAAIECGAAFINPTFLEYTDWFEGPRERLINWTNPSTDSRGFGLARRKLIYTATRLAWRSSAVLAPLSLRRIARAKSPKQQARDLKEIIEQAQCHRTHTLLLQGFEFRHAPWVENHAAILRSFFLPLSEYRLAAELVVSRLRQQCDIVVAVHLRHGDYRTYKGGRYFWPVATYRSFIDRMCQLLAPKKLGFLICSNAQHADEHFSNLTWSPGPGSVPGDLHALSLCDYIMGPQSTFSAWAAFHGNTKLLHLESGDQRIEIGDFQVRCAP